MKEKPDSFCHLTKWYILAYIEYCKENKVSTGEPVETG